MTDQNQGPERAPGPGQGQEPEKDPDPDRAPDQRPNPDRTLGQSPGSGATTALDGTPGPGGSPGQVPGKGPAAQQPEPPQQKAAGNSASTILQAGHSIHINSPGLAERAIAVSVAPPLGRRDPATPLRGRADLLDELTALLDPQDPPKAAVPDAAGTSAAHDLTTPRVRILHGLGGCGKTSVALDLTHHAAERGLDVWWVSAVDAISLTAAMHAVARRVGAGEEELLHGDAPDVLWRHLDSYGRRWLLVVDNADDPEILAAGPGQLRDGQGWVRPHSHRSGLVVVTTRDGNPATWGKWCALRSVGMLDTADAARVLLDYTADRAGSAADAAALAHRLNGLPIVLRLAGAYLAETTLSPWPGRDAITSFAGYLAALDDGRLDIYDADGSAVGRSWELSLDLLARQGIPQARPLLRLLSCLADAPIAYSLILDPGTLARSPLFEGLDGNALWQVLKALANLCLIDLSAPVQADDLPLLRVHPLVREASRRHLRKADGQAAVYVTTAAALLHRAAEADMPGSPESPPAWPLWQAIAPHTLHVARTAAATPELPSDVVGQITGAAHLVARNLRSRGQYATAEAEYRFLLAVQARVLGDDHPLTLSTRHSIGGVLHDRGRLVEAEAEWRAVLGLRQRVLGGGHADTLFTRHGLALVLHDLGLLIEAETEWRAVLAFRIDVLGERHPHTLATRHSLAVVLHQRRQYGAAEAEYRQVLAIQQQVVGGSHPDTLATRHRIALVLHDRGEFQQAEPEFRSVLGLRREVLGADHPHTLATSHGFATALHDRGEFEQAEAEFRTALELRRRVLGEDHPHTLETRCGFASALRGLGRSGPAAAEYEVVLRARVRLLGEDDPRTVAVRRAVEKLRSLACPDRDGAGNHG